MRTNVGMLASRGDVTRAQGFTPAPEGSGRWRTIDLTPGMRIEEAAHLLVANAPAKAVFNDIPIRAKYATTRPSDIVRQFHLTWELNRIRWLHSPAAKVAAARRAAEVARLQEVIDLHVANLPDFTSPASVLTWVEVMAPAVDDFDVRYDHESVVTAFAEAGWAENANMGEEYDAEDARNTAGWIVGQWLPSKYPRVGGFIERWRKKFVGE